MATSFKDSTKSIINLGNGKTGHCYSLPALEKAGLGKISRLPVSLRIVLESLLRNCDGKLVTEQNVRELASWKPNGPRTGEIPFIVGRVVLNCMAGIPLLGDLTAIRGEVNRRGLPMSLAEPKVPVDMVLDHTLTVDYHGTADALEKNNQLDIQRNAERFRFVKWAMQAYKGIRLIPPGGGILHQVNLEYLAPGVLERDGAYFPDSLVGTDSHTGMIAGLGCVGWGVGGIEAEAATLGQPVYLLTPDVVGVHVTGALKPGVTATDMVLHVTEMLRKAKVVGKFVEFFGVGVANLTVPDRATLSNMSPEYGATIGYFPVDEQTLRYLRQTGRPEAQIAAAEAYYRMQGIFGAAEPGEVDYSQVLTLDLDTITPNVAGPKRPQDRVPLAELKQRFDALLTAPVAEGGYGKKSMRKSAGPRDGDVVIAAIASCTNTSNPGVILAAGLLAKKAVARGLQTQPWVKTSLTPGSVAVGNYLAAAGLQPALDHLGFNVAGYSCTTCFGGTGPIDAQLEKAIIDGDAVTVAVVSGNRNFEARIHPAVRAAFLMSPPLIVAFAIAGRIDIDLASEPLGTGADGKPVFLKDIWPANEEIAGLMATAMNPENYRAAYGMTADQMNPLWHTIAQSTGELFPWSDDSTYIKEPPWLSVPELTQSSLREYHGARALALLGNSITTDHISPIGSIKATLPAGEYLQQRGVKVEDFNNYGSRRMNHEVMMRGTFANIRLRNMMTPGVEGGVTVHQPGGERMSIYDAAIRYAKEKVPLIVIAGEEYGTGSARDWAAKGTRLLGVRVVIANSFERIHRSNLVGLGVVPCQLPAGMTVATLGLTGRETYDVLGLDDNARPRQPVTLVIHHADGSKEGRTENVTLTLRLDTQAEIEYVKRGGILPYVLEGLAA
jgi:aconitate hydratase